MPHHRYDALARALPLPARHAQPTPVRPAAAPRAPLALADVLSAHPDLPDESLLLGMAQDALPVLLNLAEPDIGALQVSGRDRSALRAFLYALVRSAAAMHPASRLQFGLISPLRSCWEGLSVLPHCAGIFSIWQNGADDLVMALTNWAYYQRRPVGRQFVLLLLDGLEEINRMDDEARYNLEWLLQHGPQYEVWPVAVIDRTHTQPIPSRWRGYFNAVIRHESGTKDMFRLSGANGGIPFQIPTL